MPLNPDIVEQILNTIDADITACFKGQFRPREFAKDLEDAGLQEERTFATSDVLVVVPWVMRGAHVGEFLGVPPTHLEVEMRGTTFVRVPETNSADAGRWMYFRYIDYLGVLQQLGVTTTNRPALTPEQFAVWSEHHRERRPDTPPAD
jgi:SnoaL-like polyketide cyclase